MVGSVACRQKTKGRMLQSDLETTTAHAFVPAPHERAPSGAPGPAIPGVPIDRDYHLTRRKSRDESGQAGHSVAGGGVLIAERMSISACVSSRPSTADRSSLM